MKNIKKSVAVVAAILLLCAPLNLNAGNSNVENEGPNCFGLAAWVYDFVMANGGTVVEAITESGIALRECERTIGFD